MGRAEKVAVEEDVLQEVEGEGLEIMEEEVVETEEVIMVEEIVVVEKREVEVDE